MAVDELAIRKGHNYATLVLDFERRRVVWIGEGRPKETLDTFYNLSGAERCKDIEAVAMDMWDPYVASTWEHCPQADIVYDKFHVIRNFSKVIDEVRNQETRKAEDNEREVIKGTKYILTKE